MPRPNIARPPAPDIDDIPLRTCKDCGREIFNPPDEGVNGDDDLCTDCWDGGLDAEYVG